MYTMLPVSDTTTERFNPQFNICFRQPHGFIITTRCENVIAVAPLSGGFIFCLFNGEQRPRNSKGTLDVDTGAEKSALLPS